MSDAKKESFFLPSRELRISTDAASGSRTLVGTIPYNSPSVGLPWTETIAAGAFSGALKPGSDVLMLRDHDSSLLMGRTLAGTLSLGDSADGLQFKCTLPNTSAANDLIESMNRRDITGVSFGFVTTEDTWADDGAGSLTRVLRAVELFEISVTSFAAYPDASAAIRSVVPEEFRSLLKRSKRQSDSEDDDDLEDDDEEDDEEGSTCECPCTECVDGNCADCSNPDCDDPNCDEIRSGRKLTWSEKVLLRVAVARRVK
jgi:HK97 family phage prohead protease